MWTESFQNGQKINKSAGIWTSWNQEFLQSIKTHFPGCCFGWWTRDNTDSQGLKLQKSHKHSMSSYLCYYPKPSKSTPCFYLSLLSDLSLHLFLLIHVPLFLIGEPGDGTDTRGPATEVSQSQHVLICALQELGSLVKALTTCAMPLVSEPTLSKHCLLYSLVSSLWCEFDQTWKKGHLLHSW